jgi:hypothetical protein
MIPRLLCRFAAAVLTATFATAASSAPPPKPVLLDCQVIPIRCAPEDVCQAAGGTVQSSDEYHFAFNKDESALTNSNSSAKTTITKTVTSSGSSRETSASRSVKTNASSTAPTQTTTIEMASSSDYKVEPTPIPSKKPQGVTTTTVSFSHSTVVSALNRPGTGTLMMLDTPHDYPSVDVSPTPLTAALVSFDNALAWNFPKYQSTRFVLWRDTLRLDVTTELLRYVSADRARELNFHSPPKDSAARGSMYRMTVLWTGPCSQAATQLP